MKKGPFGPFFIAKKHSFVNMIFSSFFPNVLIEK